MQQDGPTWMIKHALLVAALGLSGCASMAEGTVDQSRETLVTSNPSGAALTQGGRVICTTPCTVRQAQLDLTKPLTFTFPDGARTESAAGLNWNASTLGNAAFGGPLGLAVDVLSGRVILSNARVHAVSPNAAP